MLSRRRAVLAALFSLLLTHRVSAQNTEDQNAFDFSLPGARSRGIGGAWRSGEIRRHEPEGFRTMRRFEHGHADAIVADECAQPRERFVKLIRIAQHTFKKSELLLRRANRRGGELQTHDWIFGGETIQVRVQHAKEYFDIARG